MEILKANYQWIFSGAGITILIFLYKAFGKKQKKAQIPILTNTISINNSQYASAESKEINAFNAAEDRLKLRTRILFIDDMYSEYKMVSILKKAGWTNTKAIKDILDLDDQIVLDSDIIFVDINGVGVTLFEDQGLGLASALKNKYQKKKVILYSAETSGDRFHKALRQVDDCLAKNAEPYQFINLVESLAKEIYL